MKMRMFRWAAVAAFFAVAACDGPLDIDPTSSIPSDQALKNAREIALAVNGAYSILKEDALYSRELTAYPELYADNLTFTGTYASTDGQVGNRNIRPANVAIRNAWREHYDGIKRANTVLAALASVDDLSDDERDQYRGEMLFLRGLYYLNLVRYFGGVPIVLEPTETLGDDDLVSRASQEDVYARIVEDLTEAISLLDGKKPGAGRASKGAAQALLARAYLEMGEWAEARDMATEVIANGGYEIVADYADLFETKNSRESILEVQYSTTDSNNQAYWHFPSGLGGRRGYAPTRSLYDAYEPGDVRRDVSIGIYTTDDGEELLYGKKYFRIASGDDNIYVLRLAEMYLIRAEANARLGAAPATVREDINVIRNRAGLADLPSTVNTEEALIDAILQERRLEFAMEGHRFFDLRRTGRAMDVLGISEGRLLFPIPQAELDVNKNLTQNPGY